MRANVSTTTSEMSFGRDGAQCFRSALDPEVLDRLRAIISDVPSEKAGVRLIGIRRLNPLLSIEGAIGAIVRSVLGERARPVRAIMFDKTARTNWRLAWHQDRTIVVKRRIDVEGYGPWSNKSGLHHVAPPFHLLAEMLTLRVHLDDVGVDNAPLLIAPGSHRFGRVAEAEIKDAVQKCGIFACLAATGDIWLYATPILHASDAATVPSRRRVLQIDYSARDLPGGLDWLGV
jgi:ectoine hydroxylase-related dioxygenase (phytanoyl-CoA dioxygenase family)